MLTTGIDQAVDQMAAPFRVFGVAQYRGFLYFDSAITALIERAAKAVQ